MKPVPYSFASFGSASTSCDPAISTTDFEYRSPSAIPLMLPGQAVPWLFLATAQGAARMRSKLLDAEVQVGLIDSQEAAEGVVQVRGVSQVSRADIAKDP